MKKNIPILIALLILFALAYVVIEKKRQVVTKTPNHTFVLNAFTSHRGYEKLPDFLHKLNIIPPVMIDLSQKKYKGIALLFGKQFKNVYHPKQWEQYAYFSTYTLDEKGNVYLVPMPFISIYPTTFNLQKNIYKLDTKTGKVSIFMQITT